MIAKQGVKLETLRPEARRGLEIADTVLRCEYDLEGVVTSTNDGRHKRNSLHYKDLAFDLRLPSRLTKTPFNRDFDKMVHASLKQALGPDFDVILETHQLNKYQHHIHVEYDPKSL